MKNLIPEYDSFQNLGNEIGKWKNSHGIHLNGPEETTIYLDEVSNTPSVTFKSDDIIFSNGDEYSYNTGELFQEHGYLYGFGYNWTDELGNLPEPLYFSSPYSIGSSKWSNVTGGINHAYFIDINNYVYMVGSNELTDTGENPQHTLIQIGTTKWKFIQSSLGTYSDYSLPQYTTLALDENGYLYGWGCNQYNQLGIDLTTQQNTPLKLNNTVWKSVSIYLDFAGGIDSNGYLYTWGCNYSGQIGNENTNYNYPQHTPQQIGTTIWSQISCSLDFTIALDSNGYKYGWGYNYYGQLGISSTSYRQYTPIKTDNTVWKYIASCNRGSYMISSDGYLFISGGNIQYRQATPQQIGTTIWSKIVCGQKHVLLLDSNNYLYGMGCNFYKQINDSSTTNTYYSPIQIGTSKWKDIGCGYNSSYAIDENNQLYAWGCQSSWQLGNEIYAPDSSGNYQNTPILLSNTKWKEILANYSSQFCIDENGYLYGWGCNNEGQLGLGYTSNKIYTPLKLNESKWKKIFKSLNNNSIFAVKDDDTIYCWGNNDNNKLGITPAYAQYTPYQMDTTTKWKRISAAVDFTLLLNENNNLYLIGQYGAYDSAGNSHITPFLINNTKWKDIACVGKFYSKYEAIYMIDFDNYLWVYGCNYSGKLGIGSDIFINTPIKTFDQRWKKIFISYNTCFGINLDNHLFAWGNNNWTYGNGNSTNLSYTPLQIGTSLWKFCARYDSDCTFSLDSNGIFYLTGNVNNQSPNSGTAYSSFTSFSTTKWQKISPGPNGSCLLLT